MSCSRSFMMSDNAETIPYCQPNSFRLHAEAEADRIPHMTETIHDRIQERLKALNISARAASLKADLSEDAIRKLVGNRDQLPTGKTLSGLARALETTEHWLMTGEDVPTVKTDVSPAPVNLPPRAQMPNDVPVMGTAAGSHLKGAFQLTTDAIDYVRRPPALATARDIYALYVEGTSMEPQYNPGDLVYIHPHKPPRVGDAVIIQCRSSGELMEARSGIYAKKNGETITIRKHNPQAEVELKRAHVVAVHKVLTLNELFGV
jgi:phage repressor protein C with HTH and peptisase S24 domain